MAIENSMVVGATDHYEQGSAWWLGKRYCAKLQRDQNCEPEREDAYDNVPAACKVQAMVEDDNAN